MFQITSKIGVDYGHRVMTHGSKCRNIHGHRGTIEVTCESNTLHSSGEQKDMTLDFGFLKELMLQEIDKAIDHGFVVCVADQVLMHTFIPNFYSWDPTPEVIDAVIKEKGFWLSSENTDIPTFADTKLYVVPFVPTAERLAEHFFKKLEKPVIARSNGLAKIVNLRFWETPNNYADYPGTLVNKS